MPLVVCQSFAQHQRSEVTNTAAFEGIVVDLQSGDILPDVRISLSPQSGGVRKTATTDLRGRFTIVGIQPGRYKLAVVRNGFVLTGGLSKSNDLIFGPGQQSNDLRIELQPAAIITGRVLDIDRYPVRNVLVQALRAQYRDGRRLLAVIRF